MTAMPIVNCNKQQKKNEQAPEANTSFTVGSYDGSGSTAATQSTADLVAGFILPTDLKNPGNLKSLGSSDIVSTVGGNAYFYRNGSNRTSAGGCLASTLSAHKYSVKGDRYSANISEPNLVSCFQSDPAFAGLSITNASLNFVHIVICPDADLKTFSNMSVLAAQSVAKPTECVSEVYNLRVVIGATTTQNGNRAIVTRTVNVARIGGNQVELPSGLGAPQGSALALQNETGVAPTPKGDGAFGCLQTYDGETLTSDGCQFISSTVDFWVPAIYQDNQYTMIADQALTAKSPGEGPYYASGALQFFINGWSGAMTYTAPNEQPTWSARYGAGLVASGVFGTPVPKAPTRTSPSVKLTESSASGAIDYLSAASAAIYKPFAGQH